MKKRLRAVALATLLLQMHSYAQPRSLPQVERAYEEIGTQVSDFKGDPNKHEREYIVARVAQSNGIHYYAIANQQDVEWIEQSAPAEHIHWYSLTQKNEYRALFRKPSLYAKLFEKICFSVK